MDLTNKVAVVTGGARGLGRGFAEALLQRGANVSNVLWTTRPTSNSARFQVGPFQSRPTTK